MYQYFIYTHILLPAVQTVIYGIICGLLIKNCGNWDSGGSSDCGQQSDPQIALALVATFCCLISIPLSFLAIRKITKFQKIRNIIKPTAGNCKIEFDVSTPLKSTEDDLFKSIYGIEHLYGRMLSKTSLIINFHLMLQLFVLAVSIYEIIAAKFVDVYPFKLYIEFGQIMVMLPALIMIIMSAKALTTIRKEPEYKLRI